MFDPLAPFAFFNQAPSGNTRTDCIVQAGYAFYQASPMISLRRTKRQCLR